MPNIFETTDAAANTSTAYALQIGQTAHGRISANGDHDWYRVDLVAGQTYTFAMVGTGTAGVRDPYLQIYGPGGSSVVAFNDDGLPNNNSVVTFTAATSGTYYIDAAAFNNAGSGQYGLSVALGTRATMDVQMGAGDIDAYSGSNEYSWSEAPGTGTTVTVGFRLTNDGSQPNFSQFTAAQMAAVQLILQYYSDISGLNFTIVNPGGYTDSATILLSNYNNSDGSGGYAYYPGTTAPNDVAGDVHINIAGGNSTSSLPFGSYSFYTLMHELGHTLGLTHPGLYNAGPGQSITYATHAQFTQDTHQYSVMSYFDESNTTGSWGSYPETLMMYDIYAIQQIYGTNWSTRSGNSIYGFGSNVGGVYDFTINTSAAICIWDGGGTDTLDCSGYGQNQLINLNDGTFSNVGGLTGNISIALNAIIENAIGGTGNDTITGNSYNNTLIGGGGTDTMNGNGGRDVTVFNFASTSATILHNANGSWTISGPGQTETVTNIELAQFTDRWIALREAPQRDFDGSNSSDILWRNLNTGEVGFYAMENGVSTYHAVTVVSAAWGIAGTGDFNGDGTSDILWRSTSGDVGFYEMHDGVPTYHGITNVSSAWAIAGTGDFNGDGTSDILWRSTSGSVGFYEMNNGVPTYHGITNVSAAWDIAGTGDFNGDGTSDILWRNNSSGAIGYYEMHNGVPTYSGLSVVASNWEVSGTGDYNADGTTDILWRDGNTSVVGYYEMHNGVPTWHTLSTMSSDWAVG